MESKKKYIIQLSALFVGVVLIGFGCTRSETISKTELINQKVQKKVIEFENNLRKECLLDAQLKAEEHVDSIIFLQMGTEIMGIYDTMKRPPRPDDSTGFEFDFDTMLQPHKSIDTIELIERTP